MLASTGLVERVAQPDFRVQFRRAFGHVPGELAVNKNAVARDGHRLGFIEPDVPVDARALVEPSLEPARVHARGNRVLFAKADEIRDVRPERIVAAFVMADEPAVDVNRRVAERAVELQPDALAAVRLRQVERPAIPADARRGKPGPDRLETVAHVPRRVERQLDRPVVRQVDRAPGGIIEIGARRPLIDAGFVEIKRVRPVVAEVKFPVGIERKMLVRRHRGGGERQRAGSNGQGETTKEKTAAHLLVIIPSAPCLVKGFLRRADAARRGPRLAVIPCDLGRQLLTNCREIVGK